ELVEVVIKSGSGSEKKGDSYLSTIYRFTVTATTGETGNRYYFSFLPRIRNETILVHVIAKGFPKNVARRKTFRSPDFFETEINFYNNVWPLMKEVKLSNDLEEPDEVPLLLSSFSDGKNDYIALKDISFDGYGTGERNLGIDRECASLFLKLLANFHALSIAARHQNPHFEKVARSLKETYFDERFRKWYTGFMSKNLYQVVRQAVENYLDALYLRKLEELFSNDFYGRLCELAKNYRGKLLAVTQGDAWLPNFLVKVENGIPTHAVLIDFQLARYSSLTSDLVHFLYSCLSQEVLTNHWDDLVLEYHQHLSRRIAELGCNENLITLEDLKEDMQKNSHVGLVMSMESTVTSMLTDEEVPDLDTIQGTEAVPLEVVWDFKPFEDEPRNKRVAFLIKHAVDKGFM
ncbi:hypothetical protein NQ315_003819, partial [Exocentrus adspersus]